MNQGLFNTDPFYELVQILTQNCDNIHRISIANKKTS